MSRTVTITLTDDEIDQLESLALIRDTRGSRRSRLVAEIVRYHFAHLPAKERDLVDMLVALRNRYQSAPAANVIPLRARS